MRYTLDERYRFTEVDGGGVLLDLADGEYWQLNPLAASLIQRVINGDSAELIVAELVEKYPDFSGRIHDDVAVLLQQLQRMGAVHSE